MTTDMKASENRSSKEREKGQHRAKKLLQLVSTTNCIAETNIRIKEVKEYKQNKKMTVTPRRGTPRRRGFGYWQLPLA